MFSQYRSLQIRSDAVLSAEINQHEGAKGTKKGYEEFSQRPKICSIFDFHDASFDSLDRLHPCDT
jgi:hypothetical protein